jgi:hypothetical protein
LLALAIFVISSSFSFASDQLRRWPFPFSNVITFSGDADMQVPWFAAAFHAQINDTIGLPLSESLWISGSQPNHVSLLNSQGTLDRTPSGWRHHSVAGLLIRQWHRGNIDTFHGWQDDGWLRLFQNFDPPLALSSDRISLDVLPAPEGVARGKYPILRLFFDAPPPTDLVATLADQSGPLGAATDLRGDRKYQTDKGEMHYLDILLDEASPGVFLRSADTSARDLRRLELRASSCANGCPAHLVRIERDGFSRKLVMDQIATVEALNLRPAYVTSHGGYTYAQDFGYRGCCTPLDAPSGSVLTTPGVSVALRNEAENPSFSGYHADLLQRLGVVAVWPIRSDRGQAESKLPQALRVEPFADAPFYAVPRTMFSSAADLASPERFAQSLRDTIPGLGTFDGSEHYCPTVGLCEFSSSGSLIGLMSDISLARIDGGNTTEHFWYTHFGTIPYEPSFKARPERPLRPAIINAMRRLADRVYNPRGDLPMDRLVWVPPTGSLVRYQTTMAHAAEHITVSGSHVEVRSWTDPTTGRIVPETRAGTRDLDGVTVYVAHSAEATVEVDGHSITTFTRNGPDQSGRESVTIVGDNAATAIIGRVPLRERGEVKVDNAFLPPVGRDADYATMVATSSSGSARLTFQPRQLGLWNTSHIKLAYRIIGAPLAAAPSLSVTLTMEDGGEIAIGTQRTAADPAAGAWKIPEARPGQWQYATLATNALNWPADTGVGSSRLPLPIGFVHEVKVLAAGLVQGSRLDLRLEALRPSGNGVGEDGHVLLAGQATSLGGEPQRGITVEAHDDSGLALRTVTDADGYYYFDQFKRQSLVTVRATIGSQSCASLLGGKIELLRDEAEADINLSDCER